LREQQVEADRMIEDLGAALAKDGLALLDEAEYNCLEVAVKELQLVRDSSTEHRVLMRQIESVGKVSEEFAARRMDASIKNALAGQSLDDVENTL
jgi:molecular chaperone HscA